MVSLQNNAGKIDILAPQFYAVSSKLKLDGSIDAPLQKIITQKGIRVMPLVTNAGFNQILMHKLLLSPGAQDAIIKSLIDEAKNKKYIGWQFDFENISYLDKDLYSVFVEKAVQALHKNNLILSIAASVRSVDYEDTSDFKNWSGVFDYARLAKVADFISFMTYDDPNSLGPVASLPFINKALDYVKDKIPADKLSMGIPLYNWGWRTEPFKKITSDGTYAGLSYIRSNFQCNSGFNGTLGASWLTYSYNNKQYQIWYQDKQGFGDRLDIIKQNGFRGFSSWVLGIEDPAIWTTLSNNTD